MLERFTAEARAVLTAAQHEARALGHPYLGTEHLLLGLLDPASGRTAELLAAAGVHRARVVAEIERLRPQPAGLLGPADVEALRAIGIEADAVVRAVEDTFGPGALQPPPVPPRPWPDRLYGRIRRLRPRYLLRRWRRYRNRRREAALRAQGLAPAPGGHLPFVPRSKQVLELALRESLRLRHDHIGSEHILLGLLREGAGLAALILVELGLVLDDLRERTLRALADAA